MGEKEIFIGVVCVQNWKTEQNIKWCGLLWKVAVAMCNFSQCRRCHITVILLSPFQASLVAQMVKNLPAIQETKVWSLGWEDPLKEHIATHSSILAWRIPMDRKAWQATVHRGAKSWTWWSTPHIYPSFGQVAQAQSSFIFGNVLCVVFIVTVLSYLSTVCLKKQNYICIYICIFWSSQFICKVGV